MKIVSTELPYEYEGVLMAMAVSLKEKHSFDLWKPDVIPLYFMLRDKKPDYIIVDINKLSPAFLRLVNEENCPTKLILVGAGVPQQLDGNKNVSLLMSSGKIMEKIRENILKDNNAVFLKESANIAQRFSGKKDKKYRSRVSIIVDDRHKGSPQVLSLCTLLSADEFKFRLYGFKNSKIHIPEYVGELKREEISSVYKSTEINLDIDGSKLLDIAANKGFAASSVNNLLYPSFSTYDELREIIEKYKRQKDRDKIAQEAYAKVMKNDTSFHRAAEVFTAINEPELAKLALEKLESVVSK